MTNSSITADLKKSDAALSVMRGFFESIMSHRKSFILLILLACAGFGAWFWQSTVKEKARNAAFEELFTAEKTLRESLEAAQKKMTDATAADAKKSAESEKASKDQFETEKNAALDAYAQTLAAFSEKHRKTDAGLQADLKLGRVYEEKEKWADAEKSYANARAQTSKGSLLAVTAAVSLARVLENQGKWEEAFKIYQETEGQAGTFPKSFFQMAQARCHIKLNRKEDAHKIYAQIEKDDKDPFAHEAKGFRRLLDRESRN